jgi:hypothetical protein
MRSANNLTLMTGKVYLSEHIRIADFGGLNFATLNACTLESWAGLFHFLNCTTWERGLSTYGIHWSLLKLP